MCGRYAVISSVGRIAARLGVVPLADRLPADHRPRYNAAPGQPLPVIRADAAGAAIELLRWGLVPGWARDPAIGSRLVNARAETVAEKPSFRAAFRGRRCLVPIDGFYEWQRLGTSRQPWFFAARDAEPLFLAGLWERNTRCGTPLVTFTILTTAANATCSPVHARMPVVLAPAHHERWLDPRAADRDALAALLVPCAPGILSGHPVTTRVNRPQHDDPGCIEPAGQPDEPPSGD